ncbi:MAG TPA: TlpA disulfide reductase family protein [Gemmatales bacterium]|nr:TlpA disulfide reductase family protein [Gemmatales bacterium]
MIPHERSLVKRLEGKPFALIGVNTDSDRDKVKTRSEKDQITWRSFYDKTTRGPICSEWQVNGFPTIYLIDHKGVIRHKSHGGPEMDAMIDKLVAEAANDAQ